MKITSFRRGKILLFLLLVLGITCPPVGGSSPAPENSEFAVWGLSVTPDGKYVATANREGFLFLWDFQTGKLAWKFSSKGDNLFAGRTAEFVISSDGSRALGVVPSSDFCQTSLWNLQTRSLVAKIKIDPFLGKSSKNDGFEGYFAPTTAAFSNDGRFLVGGLHNGWSGRDVVLGCWNAQSGELMKTIGVPLPRIWENRIAAHPDLSLIAAEIGPKIRFFGIPDLSERRSGIWTKSCRISGCVHWLSFTANGKSLALLLEDSQGTDQSFCLAGPEGGFPRRIFQMGGNWVRAAAISRDGETLVTGGLYGRIALWDIRKGQLKKSWIGHRSHVRGISLAVGDTVIVSGSDSGGEDLGVKKTLAQIKSWDLKTGDLIREFIPSEE
jgi:WD40 repeat protein